MMGKKALIIRRASLRREDIPMRIMNQEKEIAKEKSSLMGRSLVSNRPIPQYKRAFGLYTT